MRMLEATTSHSEVACGKGITSVLARLSGIISPIPVRIQVLFFSRIRVKNASFYAHVYWTSSSYTGHYIRCFVTCRFVTSGT